MATRETQTARVRSYFYLYNTSVASKEHSHRIFDKTLEDRKKFGARPVAICAFVRMRFCNGRALLYSGRGAVSLLKGYRLSEEKLRGPPTPSSAETTLIVSASCGARGDERFCQKSAAILDFLHSYLMSALGRQRPLSGV